MRFAPQRGTKYPEPPGIRGYAGAIGGKLWSLTGGVDEYIRRADVWPLNPEGELFAMIMIESAEGVKHAREIASTPGLGAIFIGPSDLSISLGVGPQKGTTLAAETEDAIQTVLKACQDSKVICGIAATWATKERRAELRRQGFRLIM
jgi:4-hydroxy-2-oxoheptanedioate aldolase